MNGPAGAFNFSKGSNGGRTGTSNITVRKGHQLTKPKIQRKERTKPEKRINRGWTQIYADLGSGLRSWCWPMEAIFSLTVSWALLVVIETLSTAFDPRISVFIRGCSLCVLCDLSLL